MSKRVPIELAASICKVKPSTIRRWAADKRITSELRFDPVRGRRTARYDIDELLKWIDARDPDALYSRAGMRPEDRPSDTRHVQAAETRIRAVP